MHCFLPASFVAGLLLTCHFATAKCETKAIFVQPASEVPETALLVVNQKFVDISLPRRNLSDAVELELSNEPGKSTIAVLPGKPNGPEIPLDAPKFTIPPTWTRCILLFFHDANNKIFPARIIPVNTSNADFPLGHILIYNVSTATVVAKLGTETVKILPGKSASVKPPRSDSGAYPVAIDCALPGDKQPTALCRSKWQYESKARQILFIVPQPEQNDPRIWGILDRENTSDTNTR